MQQTQSVFALFPLLISMKEQLQLFVLVTRGNRWCKCKKTKALRVVGLLRWIPIEQFFWTIHTTLFRLLTEHFLFIYFLIYIYILTPSDWTRCCFEGRLVSGATGIFCLWNRQTMEQFTAVQLISKAAHLFTRKAKRSRIHSHHCQTQMPLFEFRARKGISANLSQIICLASR